MSIYRENSINEDESEEYMNREAEVDDSITNTNTNTEEQNRNHQLILQNRQRQQLATVMQIPLSHQGLGGGSKLERKNPPKLTRRALKRRNSALRIGVKHQVQKCGFKAGRRRC